MNKWRRPSLLQTKGGSHFLSSTSMTISKFLLIFSIFVMLFAAIALTESPDSAANAELPGTGFGFSAEDSDKSPQVELSQLKSKISQLESKIDEKAKELAMKETTIEELEKIILEKSSSLAFFHSQIQSSEEKVSLNRKEQESDAHSQVSQLQEQMSTLKKEIESQNKKKVALEARANVAEIKIQDLNVKLDDLRRIREEQKSRIRKTQRALEVAEEELMKAKLDASSISMQLIEVHEAWIPRWLAIHFDQCRYFLMTAWNKHGRPVLDLTVKKAADKRTELEKWAKPYSYKLKSKWIPLIKKRGLAFRNDFDLVVQSLTATGIDKYHEAKKFMKPYVDQVSALSKPHLDRARVYLKPYTKKVFRNYKNFSRKWHSYHRQVQATILDMLKSHEFTRPYATKVFAWYMALAIMALPVVLVLNMVSAVFSEKPTRRRRASNSSQTRRKSKRVHHER